MKDPNRRYTLVHLLFLNYHPAKQAVCGKRNVMQGGETESRPSLVEDLYALLFVCQLNTFKWIPLLFVSISKPVYLTNSHLIFLYLYSDRKRICAFCTVCWIYPNRDFTPRVVITFIEREKYNKINVLYCSQNIYQCGLMQLQNAELPEC